MENTLESLGISKDQEQIEKNSQIFSHIDDICSPK